MDVDNPTFELFSGRIAIGDGIMHLAFYDFPSPPGLYQLDFGALQDHHGPERGFMEDPEPGVISLDGTYVWVFDASLEDQFLTALEQLKQDCSYDMLDVTERHVELEETLGHRIAFYWESDLSGQDKEGRYRLRLDKVRPE